MKVTRKSVFETNSSSTHSITIADSGSLKNSLVCRNGVIKISGDEFGWEEEEYNDAETKLKYLITRIFYNAVHIDNVDEKPSIHWNEINKDWWYKVQKAVEDFTGCQLEVVLKADYYHPIGYIDHQSMDVADKVLNGSVGKIKRFIFNPRSVLITDHDNHYDWSDYE